MGRAPAQIAFSQIAADGEHTSSTDTVVIAEAETEAAAALEGQMKTGTRRESIAVRQIFLGQFYYFYSFNILSLISL